MEKDYSIAGKLRPNIHIADIGREGIGLQGLCGSDNIKRGNLAFIDEDTVIFVTGNAVIFQNIYSDERKYLMGIDEGGVGCIAVHPSRNYFAVGGKGCNPKIYIYEYPSLKITKVLSGGAERGFATMSFNRNGSRLASVATSPDYMLTVWDWDDEKMGLHAKAFGQDIFTVKFSQDDDFRLTTSGTGHIRFWKIASTFTGTKLQGLIGKFGKVELSDILAFTELPDGKVLSGTEFGSLLLWEGNFIKCRFVQSNGSLCHQGEITYVEYDRKEGCIVTAGNDGYIRWWDFRTIDTAEIDSDDSMDYRLTPTAEYFCGSAGITSMVDSGTIQSARNLIFKTTAGEVKSYKFDLREKGSDVASSFATVTSSLAIRSVENDPFAQIRRKIEVDSTEEGDKSISAPVGLYYSPRETVLVRGHVGKVTGLDTCPCGPYAASCDNHGNVFLWDYTRNRLVTSRSFPDSSCTCLKWLPQSYSGAAVGAVFAVGFADGVVRLLSICQHPVNGIQLILNMAIKPHDAPVTCIAFSSRGVNTVATSANNGTIFFFHPSTGKRDKESIKWNPIRYISLSSSLESSMNYKKDVYCMSFSWSGDGTSILCSCDDSVLREIKVKHIVDLKNEKDTDIESFEITAPVLDLILKAQDTPSTAVGSQPPIGGLDANPSSIGKQASLARKGSMQSNDSRRTSIDRSNRNSTAAIDPLPLTHVVTTTPLQSHSGIYSLNRRAGGLVTCSSYANDPNNYHIFEATANFEESIAHELPYGQFSYSAESKDHVKSSPMHGMKYSWSGRLLAQAGNDGSVVVRPSLILETFVRSISHNSVNTNGQSSGTTCVAISYDDKYLLTGGVDGVIAIQRLRLDLILSDVPINLAKDIDAGLYEKYNGSKNPYQVTSSYTEPRYLELVSSNESIEEQYPNYIVEDDLESNEDDISAALFIGNRLIVSLSLHDSGKDITSPTAYSIQNDKLRHGDDIRQLAAEEVKNEVRQAVKELRNKYDYIRRRNESLPEVVRLSNEKLMQVDGDYWDLLEAKKQEKIEEVHKECAYAMEKSIKLREKIINRFMDGVVVEEMKLSSFPSYSIESDDHDDKAMASEKVLPYVLSLRTKVLDKKVIAVLNSIRSNRMNEQANSDELIGFDDGDKSNAIASMENTEDNDFDPFNKTKLVDQNNVEDMNKSRGTARDGKRCSSGGPNAGISNTTMLRRDMRKQRIENLKIHESKKPREDEDDIRDITAINEAEKTLGNYKLKYSDDYEVTEENRINAPRKKIQMALLEEKMVIMRLEFNEKFLGLRKLKYNTINEIQQANRRISEINQILNQSDLSEHLIDLNHDPKEYPDDRDEVTIEELNEYRRRRGISSPDELPGLNNTSKSSETSWEKVVPPSHSVITGEKTIISKYSDGSYNLMKSEPKEITIDSLRHFDVKLSSSTKIDQNVSENQNNPTNSSESDSRVLKAFYAKTFEQSESKANRKTIEMNRQINKNLAKVESILPTFLLIKNTRMLETNKSNNFKSDTKIKPSELILQNRQKELIFEKNNLIQEIQKKMKLFNDKIKELIVERHNIISELKLHELQLVTLFQEYQLLLTFEDKDMSLQLRQQRCQGELNEMMSSMDEVKVKLDLKLEELNNLQNKMSSVNNELKNILPENHPNNDILTKIFKKKIKRIKINKGMNNSVLDENGMGNSEVLDDDVYIDDEEDDNDDDDEFDEIEDVCPNGCEPLLYEKIIDLREKRVNIDEATSDVNKVIDEYKKTFDRYKQREKQIQKDVQQADIEMRQFHLQKQAALNQIEVVIPIKLSQIYAFDGSGVFTKPHDILAAVNNAANAATVAVNSHGRNAHKHLNDVSVEVVLSPEEIQEQEVKERLKDPMKRQLVTNVDTSTHVLFDRKELLRLDERIRELHEEYDNAQKSLKDLHKERVRLKREKEARQEEITALENKCNELQMLKFGRIIHLDDLEIGSDRSKEEEAEAQIKFLEKEYRKEHAALMKEIEQLQEQLAVATVKNTECLRKVAELTQEKLNLTRSLNYASPSLAEELLPKEDHRDRLERQRLTAYIKAQENELESLKMEITILKRKDIPPIPIANNLPPPPATMEEPSNIILPPIREAKAGK